MNILLGISAGIAAYKACDIVREASKLGHNVKVVVSPNAREFVSQLTLESLSGNTVYLKASDGPVGEINHIELSKWAEVFLIAPATADCIAKLANGIGDELLSSCYLAFAKSETKRCIIAPAMNTTMWEQPAFQRNIRQVQADGVQTLEPTYGELVCKDVGKGKMASLDTILSSLVPKGMDFWKGKRVLITTGPTREYIDPVRFLSSPATGSMGFAIASQAELLGAEVHVIHGPCEVPAMAERTGCTAVTSAEEMHAAVMQQEFDVFISAAAVADFRPKEYSPEKQRKNAQSKPINIELTRNPDILLELGKQRKPGQTLIGFCAQTNEIEKFAKEKLENKNLDFIVANRVWKDRIGFGSGPTSVIILSKKNRLALDQLEKTEVAVKLLSFVARHSTKQHEGKKNNANFPRPKNLAPTKERTM